MVCGFPTNHRSRGCGRILNKSPRCIGVLPASACVLQTNTFGLVRLLVGGQLPIDPATGGPHRWVTRSIERSRWPLTAAAVVESRHRHWSQRSARRVSQDRSGAARCGLIVKWPQSLCSSGCVGDPSGNLFDPVELRLAVRAVREVASALPLLVSLTVTHGQQGLKHRFGAKSHFSMLSWSMILLR